MKLGTETGSLQNHIFSRAVIGQPEPEIGMGATILHWTDRDPGTIVSIETERPGGFLIVAVQIDKATRTDNNGMSESQSYTFERNPEGPIAHWRRTKTGAWQSVTKNVETGRWNKRQGSGLRIGERSKYHDFSF